MDDELDSDGSLEQLLKRSGVIFRQKLASEKKLEASTSPVNFKSVKKKRNAPKTLTTRKGNTSKQKKVDNFKLDPDYTSPSTSKCKRKSSEEAICAQTYNEIEMIMASTALDKNKIIKMPSSLKVQFSEQASDMHVGQGKIGIASNSYNKDKRVGLRSIKDLSRTYSRIFDSMTEEEKNKVRERENNFYKTQKMNLTMKKNFKSSSDIPAGDLINENIKQNICKDMVEPVVPVLSEEKIRWIQNFVDSTRSSVSPNCTEEESLILNSGQKLVSESHEKTILQRVDFKKHRRRSKSLVLTSTPVDISKIFSTSTLVYNSETKEKLSAIKKDLDSQSHLQFSSVLLAESVENNAGPSSKSRRKLKMNRSFSEDNLASFDRSFVTLRKPREDPKQAEDTNKSMDDYIMDYVNDLVKEEEADIIQAVEEKCRLLTNIGNTQNILNNALDDVIMLNNEPIEILDDSTVYPNDISDTNNNATAQENCLIEVIDDGDSSSSDVEIISGPSTSIATKPRRTNRKRRSATSATRKNTPRKKQKKGKALNSELPPTSSNPPPSEKPVGSGITKCLNDCPICLEPLASKEISATICGHVFCTTCIVKSVRARRACPNCRTALTLKKIHPLFI